MNSHANEELNPQLYVRRAIARSKPHPETLTTPERIHARWFLAYLCLAIIGLVVLIVGWLTGYAGY
jgi:hypothetical protein